MSVVLSQAWKWAVLLWILAALGVAAPVSAQVRVDVAIDAAFTPQEYDNIRHALENWNTALAHHMEFAIAPGRYASRTMQGEMGVRQQGLLMLRIPSHHPMLEGPFFKSTLAISIGPASRGFVYVVYNRIPKRALAGITMHEVGHSLGAGHLEKGLMAPRYSPRSQRCIDAMTMRAVAAAQRMSFDRLDWCR